MKKIPQLASLPTNYFNLYKKPQYLYLHTYTN